MKRALTITTLSIASSFGASVVLSEHDFDSNNSGLNGGNPGAVLTTTSDPTGSGMGNVGSVNIGGAAPVWGEIRTTPIGHTLPVGTVAGVDSIVASFDIYLPSSTTFSSAGAGTDRVNLIIRQSSGPDNGNRVSPGSSNNNWDTLAQDTWQTISVNVPISAVDNASQPITELTPILSFYDPADPAADGVAAYIDNWSFSVTNTVPEPSSALLIALGGLGLIRRRR